MGRPKKKAVKAKKIVKEKKDPRIEETYEEEVTFVCPMRGLVKQKIKVKRYKPLDQQDNKNSILPVDKLAEQLDSEDDGMSIYSDGEELGLTDKGGE